MKKISLLLFLFIPFSLLAQTAFYVSPTGNNNNPGTLLLPWKTFQKACNSALPGSTVYLRGGTYSKAVLNVSGTPGNYITFKSYPGELAVIDGLNTRQTLFYAFNKSYVKLVDLEFRNAIGNYSIGIEFEGACSNIEIRNNKIHDIHFSAIPTAIATSIKNTNPLVIYATDSLIASTNILIIDNEIYNCRTGFSEACTVAGNISNWQIIGNAIHDISNIGIDAIGGEKICKNPLLDVARNGLIKYNTVYRCKSPYASAAGIYIDGGSSIIIENNLSFNNQYGIEVGCEIKNIICSGITVRENIAHNNDEAGLAIGGYNFPNTGKVINCDVHNNTFYNNDFTNKGQGEITITRLENSSIQNNIFHGGAKRLLLTSTIGNSFNNVINYNNWYTTNSNTTANMFVMNGTNYKTLASFQLGTTLDLNSVFGNPNFTNAAGYDFHINIGSAAYNAGNPGFIAAIGETDYDGNSRVSYSVVDAGAYEAINPLRTVSDDLSFNIEVFPNPAQDYINIITNKDFDHILVTDLNGKTCINCNSISALDIKRLNTGIHFLLLFKNNHLIASKRFIKSN